MDVKEIRKLAVEEIKKLVKEHKEKVVDLRFKLVNSEAINNAEIRKEKKTVARLMTVLNEKRNEK